MAPKVHLYNIWGPGGPKVPKKGKHIDTLLKPFKVEMSKKFMHIHTPFLEFC